MNRNVCALSKSHGFGQTLILSARPPVGLGWWGGFIRNHHTDLLHVHTKPIDRNNMTVGAQLSTNNASRLEVWLWPCLKHQTASFLGTLVGRTKWKPSSIWRTGRGHLVCTEQFVDGSTFLSNVIQDRLATLWPETEVGAYILVWWLFMYLPWKLPVCQNLPHLPQNQMEQGRVTTKSIRFSRFSFSQVMRLPYAV